jgi:AcrR family transcriptional regulator
MSSRGQIEQVAVRLFAARGFAATGIREIGREVGLNSATLYHYAGGKEELLVGVMRTGLEELIRIGREAVEFSAEPAVQLARLVRAHVGMEAVNPLTSRVVDGEVHALTGENRRVIVGLRDEYESLLQAVLERGAGTGQFQVTDLRVARFALLEMCNGVANWYRSDGRLSVAELQDRFVELACRLAGTQVVLRSDAGPEIVIPRLDSEPVEHDAVGGASA